MEQETNANAVTIILIRHGSTTKDARRDCLTALAKEYASRLPQLLKSKGYDLDEALYVNRDRGGHNIRRCHETIIGISCNKIPVRWNGFPFNEIDKYSGKTIVLCYIKQSIRKFPQLPSDYFVNTNNKYQTDLLYENIVVIKHTGTHFNLVEEIPTGDMSVEKQNDL